MARPINQGGNGEYDRAWDGKARTPQRHYQRGVAEQLRSRLPARRREPAAAVTAWSLAGIAPRCRLGSHSSPHTLPCSFEGSAGRVSRLWELSWIAHRRTNIGHQQSVRNDSVLAGSALVLHSTRTLVGLGELMTYCGSISGPRAISVLRPNALSHADLKTSRGENEPTSHPNRLHRL